MAWPICPDCGKASPRRLKHVTYDVQPEGITRWRAYRCTCGWTGLTAETVRFEHVAKPDARKLGEPHHLADWSTLVVRDPSCVPAHNALLDAIFSSRRLKP